MTGTGPELDFTVGSLGFMLPVIPDSLRQKKKCARLRIAGHSAPSRPSQQFIPQARVEVRQ
jgi:hypothetical protein